MNGCSLRPTRSHGIPSAPVPHDTSLDGRVTAKTIDYTLPSVRELLTEFRHQRETGEIRPLATPDLFTPQRDGTRLPASRP